MTFAIERLHEGLRPLLVAHFLALPMKDRCLRFGRPLALPAIAAYIEGIDFGRDEFFGVRDPDRVLVGAVHVALEGDLAELGLSVLPAHRRRGIGSALFERAAAHARNRSIPRLLMHFLADNGPIMRMARRFGMRIVTSAGDADAHLELRPPPGLDVPAVSLVRMLLPCRG
ncbi:MAG TPA: GNAT family N-acetyltransferase [Rhodanobacteraceae bacterium]|nr:GNAT family N-acetyltransferase [Rhodanobacteraceae bacterium]